MVKIKNKKKKTKRQKDKKTKRQKDKKTKKYFQPRVYGVLVKPKQNLKFNGVSPVFFPTLAPPSVYYNKKDI